jgi:hypothetical protein
MWRRRFDAQKLQNIIPPPLAQPLAQIDRRLGKIRPLDDAPHAVRLGDAQHAGDVLRADQV